MIVSSLPYLKELPSQTAGPYVHIGLIPHQAGFDIFENNFSNVLVGPETQGERIRVEGRAPEIECIGTGKAHKPYEFGVKVSVATPLHRCKGGQFVAHVTALPGNPSDGHTLATVIPLIEQ